MFNMLPQGIAINNNSSSIICSSQSQLFTDLQFNLNMCMNLNTNRSLNITILRFLTNVIQVRQVDPGVLSPGFQQLKDGIMTQMLAPVLSFTTLVARVSIILIASITAGHFVCLTQ